MFDQVPQSGAADDKLVRFARDTWLAAAGNASIDLSQHEPAAPLQARLEWAAKQGLTSGTVLARTSSANDKPIERQLESCLTDAVRRGSYIPSEFVCVSQSARHRHNRNDAHERVKALLALKLASVVFVDSVSRLFDETSRGKELFQAAVASGGRGISVDDEIDTNLSEWEGIAAASGMLAMVFAGGRCPVCRAKVRRRKANPHHR